MIYTLPETSIKSTGTLMVWKQSFRFGARPLSEDVLAVSFLGGYVSSRFNQTHCWWFRNPKQPPGMVLKPCKYWDVNYQPPSTGSAARRGPSVGSIDSDPDVHHQPPLSIATPGSRKAEDFFEKPLVNVTGLQGALGKQQILIYDIWYCM